MLSEALSEKENGGIVRERVLLFAIFKSVIDPEWERAFSGRLRSTSLT